MHSLIIFFSRIRVSRFLLIVFLGLGFVLVYDHIVHNVFLIDTYMQTPELWRPEEDMRVFWMLGNDLLKVTICALIYSWKYGRGGLEEGGTFGLLLGLLLSILMSAPYTWMPISLFLAVSWALSGFGTGLGLGLIFGLFYRGKSVLDNKTEVYLS